ncbi:hypothetical protein CN576_21650 [Bacillus wiedmannii]|nr:hypothetical protein CN576_21650 [Bacillus wiedmannii]
MTRLNTMARFDEPDHSLPICNCTYCDAELYEGEHGYVIDEDIYCSTQCIINANIITVITIDQRRF